MYTLDLLQATTPAYSLKMGTRIYIDANISIRQRYEAIVKTFYNTNVITANLSDARPLVDSINAWVSNITDGNIDKMIADGIARAKYSIEFNRLFGMCVKIAKRDFFSESSVENSLMLIMNALFFKGSWRGKYFSPEATRTGEFRTSENRTMLVPFMRTINRFYYSESPELDAKILRIPYHVRETIFHYLTDASHTLHLQFLLPSYLTSGDEVRHVLGTATHWKRNRAPHQ